jgi:hypothetical protein
MATRKNTAKARNAKRTRLAKSCSSRWGKQSKKYCAIAAPRIDKKDAFTVADLRNDKTKVFLKEDAIIGALWDNGYDEGTPMHAKLKKKLKSLQFDIDYAGDGYGYYERLCDNMLWEYTCMYNDIVIIKQNLLERQMRSKLMSLRAGNISFDDI